LQAQGNQAFGEQEFWGLLMQRHKFPRHFRVRWNRLCNKGERGAPSSCMCQEAEITAKCREVEPLRDFRVRDQEC
jgi:hypothetical protein